MREKATEGSAQYRIPFSHTKHILPIWSVLWDDSEPDFYFKVRRNSVFCYNLKKFNAVIADYFCLSVLLQ